MIGSGSDALELLSWAASDAPIWDYYDRGRATRLLNHVCGSNRPAKKSCQVVLRLYLADRWLKVFFHQAVGAVATC